MIGGTGGGVASRRPACTTPCDPGPSCTEPAWARPCGPVRTIIPFGSVDPGAAGERLTVREYDGGVRHVAEAQAHAAVAESAERAVARSTTATLAAAAELARRTPRRRRHVPERRVAHGVRVPQAVLGAATNSGTGRAATRPTRQGVARLGAGHGQLRHRGHDRVLEAASQLSDETLGRGDRGARARLAQACPEARAAGHAVSGSVPASTARRSAPRARWRVTASTALVQPIAAAASSADSPARYRSDSAVW